MHGAHQPLASFRPYFMIQHCTVAGLLALGLPTTFLNTVTLLHLNKLSLTRHIYICTLDISYPLPGFNTLVPVRGALVGILTLLQHLLYAFLCLSY